MTRRQRLSEQLRGVHSGLLAFCLVLVLAGVVLPSAKSENAFEAARVTPSQPIQLIVPSIKLRSKIIPIEVDQNGTLDPPEDVDLVGWWKRSAKPGAAKGQTVLTGHTVHSGGGVMDKLGKIDKGSRVQVKTGKATLNYKVTKVKTYTTAQVAKYAQTLFAQDRERGRLVLVTCTDWENGVYQSNIIVFADPDGVDKSSEKKDQQDEPVRAKAA
ncbi:MAG TPA: class F sortase [Nocardioides sp.]